MTVITAEQDERHRLLVSGEISYEDVETYLDRTVYLSIAAPRQFIREKSAFARGSYWVEPVRPSIHLTGCDLEYLNDEKVVGSYMPSLFVGVLLEGEHTGFVEGRSIATSRVGVPTLLGVGDDVEIASGQHAGQICRMSGFHVGVDFLRSFGEEAQLPGCDALAGLFAGGFLWQEVETSAVLRILLMQLADNPYQGALARLYSESRVLSALVEVGDLFREQRGGVIPQLSRSHRDHAEHARVLLDSRLADPPSVPELARLVGLNETSLRRSFKLAFGTTIIDYLRDRRLDVARVLVRERRLSIAEIAYRVGFASPANFATAYRRRFGRAPTQDL